MVVWSIEMVCYWFLNLMFDVRVMSVETDVERILGLINVLYMAEITFMTLLTLLVLQLAVARILNGCSVP